jgi:predicted nucleic acid-binding protein
VSGERVLLDSVILIDHFNGVEAATAYLKKVAERAHISAITRAEVLTGFDEEDLPLARSLLDTFPLLVIDGKVADLAAALRRSHRWRLPDAFQVAVARAHGLMLATRNTSDFPPERHDFVRVPYTVGRGSKRGR